MATKHSHEFIARRPNATVLVCSCGKFQLDMENHGRLVRQAIPPRIEGQDYGADPLGDGTFRMVPSGDVVNFEERNRRLERYA